MSMSFKKFGAVSGFSLVEVACAFFIITVALVTVMKTIAYGTSISSINERDVVAQTLLQRTLEEASTKDFSTDTTQTAFSYTGFDDYSITVVETASHLGNPFLKRIQVTVNWEVPVLGTQGVMASVLKADY